MRLMQYAGAHCVLLPLVHPLVQEQGMSLLVLPCSGRAVGALQEEKPL
jgi:hypothetical protein